MSLFLSELKTVTNEKTNNTRYFIKTCDCWSRVSKKDYITRTNEAVRSDSFLTVIKNNLIHHFKTVYIII